MREMIRTMEDSQTEQALHGLLSLNSEVERHIAATAEAVVKAEPMSESLPKEPPTQASMAALSMLLKQRALSQPSPDQHRNSVETNCSAEDSNDSLPVPHIKQEHHDRPASSPRDEYEPPRSSLQQYDLHINTVPAHTQVSDLASRASIVSSLLTLPQHIAFRYPHPHPQSVIPKMDDSASPEQNYPPYVQNLISQHNQLAAHENFLVQQQSVIVENMTLDLRKHNRGDPVEKFHKSPIKKRPYNPDVNTEEEEQVKYARRSASPCRSISPDGYPQKLVINTMSEMYAVPPSRDRQSDHMAVVAPMVQPHISPREDETKLTIPLLTYRIHEAFIQTFTFLRLQMNHMEEKLKLHKDRLRLEMLINKNITFKDILFPELLAQLRVSPYFTCW